MPSIAQEYQDPISCKKRRREDGDIQMKLSSPRLNRESSFPQSSTSRRYIPIKSSKRQRFDLPPPAPTTHFLTTPPYEHNHSLTPSIHTRENERPSYFPSQEKEIGVKEKGKDKKKNLSPCHVCHRRPTVKSELDNFADCEGCGGRTCWICVRECGGQGDVNRGLEWGKGGHRRVVCSRCCVEKGTEGEVWCLGCLKSEGDG